jgi:divalent metal cation (Fe/Co/Zn/Cd) transporter
MRFGFAQGDAVAALGVAVFIALAGIRLGQRTVDALLDAAPKGVSQTVRGLVEAMPGVVGVDALRLRPSGAQILGELEIAVPRTMPIEKAEELRNEITRALSAAIPQANLTITAAPRALDSETLRDRVLLIAARRRVSIHHVTVQDLEGRKAVSLDIELDRRMTHGAAHEIASGLETALRAELGEHLEVETHIEPLDFEERMGADAGPETSEAIRAALDRHAREGGVVAQVHGVRARRTEAGLVVNYHCRVQPSLRVDAVHEAVDDIDRAVRAEFPEIVRVVGHAEPLHS